ncbi:class I SAM-dependent methyltransferase [Pseudovibrio sp. JE062]|uniref:class I SAM-dependent methyltransferase n=1 Tax=Pseudovibrio sp. JE062 TaxID=439495 RepID=UPI000186B895|nr:class I SAM-dependent methyltransferase [Pseudovibrio sp. JE062]EEA92632.1 Tellurite resistance protein TehB [Pseudovibrio sp. JE062]
MQKYDKIYTKDESYFGHTSKQFTTLFSNLDFDSGTILDLGAGQGRDAIFLAKRGYNVIAVDSSKVGLNQLQERAEAENLPIEIVHADALGYTPPQDLDAIVADRFFHELPNNARVKLLQRMLGYLRVGGYMLIADDKSVLPNLRDALKKEKFEVLRDKNGILFTYKP